MDDVRLAITKVRQLLAAKQMGMAGFVDANTTLPKQEKREPRRKLPPQPLR